jgi:hypothetical protein
MRAANDFYPTPFSIIEKLLSQLDWPAGTLVWEPCVGDGRVADALVSHGYNVVTGDITTGDDFFEVTAAKSPYLLTNPPFSHIRQFIDHAFDIGVEKMALVCPERLWACQRGKKQLLRHRPGQFVNMDWREDYLGKGGTPDRALAVSIWDSPNDTQTHFDVWSRPS